MVHLMIVRHAKTEWNLTGRIQGRSDIPLAGSSEADVRAAAVGLRGRKIDAVISSPLCRAVRTAELLTEGSGLPVQTDDRLTERDFGAYEGRTYAELGLPDHEKLFYCLSDVAGAEPSEDVFTRVRAFLADLSSRYDGKTVLVVSHGVCISFLLYALTHDVWKEEDYTLEYIKNLTLTERSAEVRI